MGSTASKTVALVIVLSALTAGCSKVREYQSFHEAESASEAWIEDGGIYFYNLKSKSYPKLPGINVSDDEWKSYTKIERFEYCALGNKNRRQYLKDKEIAISNGEVPAPRNGWWKLKYKEKDCKEEWENQMEKDIRALEESKRYIRYCFTEDKQKVCFERSNIKPNQVVVKGDGVNTKGEVKRYFRWWTQ